MNGFCFLNLCIVLITHVVNLNFDKSTIFKTFLHDKTWILCMDVNFYNFIVVNNKERIPKITQVILKLFIVKVFHISWTLFKTNHDFRTVPEGNIFCCNMTCNCLMMFCIDHLCHSSRCRLEVL